MSSVIRDDLEEAKLKSAEARRQAQAAIEAANRAFEYTIDCEALVCRALGNLKLSGISGRLVTEWEQQKPLPQDEREKR